MIEPRNYLYILDISYYQDASGNQPLPDWDLIEEAVRQGIIDAVILRVNYGIWLDPEWLHNVKEGMSRNIPLMVYGWSLPNDDPEVSALFILDAIFSAEDEHGGYILAYWHDIERAPGQGFGNASFYGKFIKKFLENWKRVFGIYTGRWAFPSVTGNVGGFVKYPLWIAAYHYNDGTKPNYTLKPHQIPYPWTKEDLWQFTDKRVVMIDSDDADDLPDQAIFRNTADMNYTEEPWLVELINNWNLEHGFRGYGEDPDTMVSDEEKTQVEVYNEIDEFLADYPILWPDYLRNRAERLAKIAGHWVRQRFE